jgi:hypothetical protein
MARKGRGNRGKRLPIGDRHWTKSRRDEVRGSANGCAKLNEAAAIEILESEEKGVRLAERFGVAPATISSIRLGRTWKHVSQGDQQAHRRPLGNTEEDCANHGAR